MEREEARQVDRQDIAERGQGQRWQERPGRVRARSVNETTAAIATSSCNAMKSDRNRDQRLRTEARRVGAVDERGTTLERRSCPHA